MADPDAGPDTDPDAGPDTDPDAGPDSEPEAVGDDHEQVSDDRDPVRDDDHEADVGDTDPNDAGDTGPNDAGGEARTPGPTALLLDTMLGKLATYLRMCGFDAAYSLQRGVEDDDDVLALAVAEDRLLLTRDVSLARRASRSVLLTRRDVTDQLRELREAGFALSLPAEPRRCGACNGVLEALTAEESRPEHAPGGEPVWRCRRCGQHFWRGSHWDDVRERLEE